MENPDPKKFVGEFDQAVGAQLKKKDESKEASAVKKTKLAESPKAADVGLGKSAETAPAEAAQVFTPDDIFWRQGRKEMANRLEAEIKRISWLDENKIASENKIIPEIGLDLRAATIRDMLINKYRVEPDTEKANEIMTQLHEMWAEKWLEYLENQRKTVKGAEQAERSRSSVEAKPVAASRSDEALSAAAAETKIGGEPVEIKGRRRIELNEGQKKTFSELIRKAEVGKLKKELQKRYEGMDPEKMKEAREDDDSAIGNIYDVFREMLTDRKFSPENLNYFRNNFFNPQIWERYKSRREGIKVKNNENLEKHRNELVDFVGQIAQRQGYNELGAELVRRYFRTVSLLEKRIYLSSNKTN